MLELYVTLVKAEIRTLDSVPAAFREKENLYLETSWFKSAVHPFEDVTAVIPAEKVLYGSGYPLNCLQSTMTALDHSTISEEAKAMILRENAARFFLK